MSEMIQRIIEYVEDRLSSNLDFDELYRDIGYSKFHLSRAFKTKTGFTISEYYLKRRLSEAALEILNSKNRIMDISYKYGFNSDSYFCRKFKHEFDTNPYKYRKRSRYIVLTNKIVIKEGETMRYTHEEDLIHDLLLCSSSEELKGFFAKTENCVLTKQNNSQLEIVYVQYSETGLGKQLLTVHLNMITGHVSVVPIYKITDQDGPLVEMQDLSFENDTLYVSFIDHESNKTSRARLERIPEKRIYCSYSWRSR
ncbi:MAG: AraC family transcriptional regulator [Candidatus Izemoplasmatales bacterium]